MLRNKIQCSSSFRPGGLRGRCLGPISCWVRTRATSAAHVGEFHRRVDQRYSRAFPH